MFLAKFRFKSFEELLGCSFHAFFFSLSFGGFDSDFFVVFSRRQDLLCLREFSFSIPSPTYQCTKALLVHEIELVIDSGEDLSNSSGVRDHADCSHDLGKSHQAPQWVADIDTALEASGHSRRTGWFSCLDGGNGALTSLGRHHLCTSSSKPYIYRVWVAFRHHGGGFESRVGDFQQRRVVRGKLLG